MNNIYPLYILLHGEQNIFYLYCLLFLGPLLIFPALFDYLFLKKTIAKKKVKLLNLIIYLNILILIILTLIIINSLIKSLINEDLLIICLISIGFINICIQILIKILFYLKNNQIIRNKIVKALMYSTFISNIIIYFLFYIGILLYNLIYYL